MADKVIGSINSRIVKLTNNENTKRFVGRNIVEHEKKNGDCVYQISDTSYVLSRKELKYFVEHGVIKLIRKPAPSHAQKTSEAQRAALMNTGELNLEGIRVLSDEIQKEKLTHSSVKNTSNDNTAQHKTKTFAQSKSKNAVKIPSSKRKAAHVKPVEAHDSVVEEMTSTDDQQCVLSDITNALTDTSFFDDYHPSFHMDLPAHAKFMDFKEKVAGGFNKFFSRSSNKSAGKPKHQVHRRKVTSTIRK